MRKNVSKNVTLSSIYQEKLVVLVVDEMHCVQTWGEKFRESFSCIGDLRSLIPNWVRIMALTTRHTLACVIWCLSLYKPVIVAALPYRDNITYEITNNVNMDEFTSSICEELKATGAKFPKTVFLLGPTKIALTFIQ